MKALKNTKKVATENSTSSNSKSSLKNTVIQNQIENQFTGQCNRGSFKLLYPDVYYQLFGDLIID